MYGAEDTDDQPALREVKRQKETETYIDPGKYLLNQNDEATVISF